MWPILYRARRKTLKLRLFCPGCLSCCCCFCVSVYQLLTFIITLASLCALLTLSVHKPTVQPLAPLHLWIQQCCIMITLCIWMHLCIAIVILHWVGLAGCDCSWEVYMIEKMSQFVQGSPKKQGRYRRPLCLSVWLLTCSKCLNQFAWFLVQFCAVLFWTHLLTLTSSNL